MWNPFDFSVDPNMTPEQLAYKRAINANVGAGLGSANYAGAGLAQLLTGLKLGGQNRSMNGIEQTGRQGAQDAISGLYQPMQIGGQSPYQPGIVAQPQAPIDPNSPQGIAGDAMKAIGKMPDFGAVEGQYGLPAGYLQEVAQIESGMNPSAQNPNSSAGGLFQFIDSTAKHYGLADKMDPVAATDAAARLAADNAKALRAALGREPTKGELYLAHQQGAGGAIALLSNPDALASSVVGADAVNLNGGNSTMTAGDFAQKWTGKLSGNTPQQVTGQIPTAQIYDALNNDWITPEERAMLTDMLETQQNAPMEAIQVQQGLQDLQIGQAQLDAAGQPVPPPQTQYGLTPILGTDLEGNPVLMQIGEDGTAVTTKLPEGITPDMGAIAEARARGTEVGKQTGAAQMDLQGAINKGQTALDLIESVRSDPALPSITGIVQGGLFAPGIPLISGGQAGKDLSVKIDQLKGQTFLQAFESLKGAGQITEIEGQKATEAMARLNTAQSTDAYQTALDDLAGVIRRAMSTAKSKAGDVPSRNSPSENATPTDDPLGLFQ